MNDLEFLTSELDLMRTELEAAQLALRENVHEFDTLRRDYDATRVENLELKGQLYILRQALESIRLIERQANSYGTVLRLADDAVATSAGRAVGDRLRQLEAVVRALAERKTDPGQPCPFCDVPEQEAGHERACPWARAMELRSREKLTPAPQQVGAQQPAIRLREVGGR